MFCIIYLGWVDDELLDVNEANVDNVIIVDVVVMLRWVKLGMGLCGC